ncbi:hypothetical protein [Mycoplasmopsis felifaucium]|uniref:Uncharacterized protein n=2 Tax=Mycoplasmopsis felifaucium TaxID=35768 RepID=A0ABZ2RT07_9BACT
MDGHVIPFALIEKLFLISETKQLEQYNNQLEQNANEIKSIFEDLSEDDKTALGDLINEDETDFVNKQVNDFAKKNKKTVFLENSAEAKAMKVAELLSSNSSLAKQIKEMGVTIQSRCVEIINNLNEDEISLLLSEKWITPLVENIKQLPLQMLTDFERNIEKVGHKYDATYQSIQNEIEETQSVISGMIDELTGNEFDMQGLLEFKKLLKK